MLGVELWEVSFKQNCNDWKVQYTYYYVAPMEKYFINPPHLVEIETTMQPN